MHCRNLTTTSQALYRIFVHNGPLTYSTGPLETTPKLWKCKPLPWTFSGPHQLRTHRAAAYKPTKPTGRGIEDGRVIDEAIGSRQVHVVTDRGLQEPESLHTVLRSFDRNDQVLVRVSSSGPSGFPVAKIMSKKVLRETDRGKAAQLKQLKNAHKMTKQLELGWAIGDNDLGHRLKKMEEFLTQGRKVEVMLANKKGARRPTPEEAQRLLQNIRAAVAMVDGAKETSTMEGQLGGLATLFFQGPSSRPKLKSEA